MTDDRPGGLDELAARIDAARKAHRPPPARRNRGWAGAELAWRMVIDLAVGIGIGFGMGWGLDGLVGSQPLFIILFTLLGFAAGVKVMLRSAREVGGRIEAGDDDGEGR